MTNLAHNLAEVAGPCADRTAIKLDEIEITYRALDAASAAAAELLRSLGVKPGDRVGLMLPNVPQFAIAYYGILRAGGVVVPMNVLLKERETGFYLSDSQADGRLRLARRSPRRPRPAPTRRAPSASSSSPASSSSVLGAFGAGRLHGRAARGRRHRGDPLHLGHDRHAEGRRAHARQPARQHRGGHRAAAADRHGRRDPRRAAAVSLLRADLRAQREHRRRRLPDADPALRARQGARDHRARRGDRLRGRADDVLRDAQRPRPRHLRHVVAASCAPPAARRCRSRSSRASRRRSAARCSRATASARPRRSRRSTTPTASASPARSAPRSTASR